MEEFHPKLVVGSLYASKFSRTKTKQKASQSIPMGKVVHAQQGWNQSVVNQTLCIFDAPDASNNGKHVGKEKIDWMILTIIVVGPANGELKEVSNCKTPAKRLKQTEPPEACKSLFFEDETKFSGSFGHFSQSYPMGSFVRKAFLIRKHNIGAC
jgi:hypothetical protein